MQEIFTDAVSGNAWTSRTPWKISRTGIGGSTPISTQIHSLIRKVSTPDSSDSTGTSIPIGISGTSTTPPAEDIRRPGIGNKWQSTSPNIRNSDKFDAAIDVKFTNDLVVPPIFAEVFSYKLSNRSIRYLYACVGMHLATYTVNPVTPQFVDHRFSAIDSLNKGAVVCSPATRFRRSTGVSHWSYLDHDVG